MAEIEFTEAFRTLTGYAPFPWQQALYARYAAGDLPASCNLPTGLGKTSVIAVWLIALANGKPVPRRLVYVVNRRTVVDQTTTEAENYARPLAHNGPPVHPVLLDLSAKLRGMTADPTSAPLALSTLRGQFADNREWSADPSRPAVICGTVDMIGSRLLFSGYGVGFKGKPLHAGFLGQDVLLVHDEAHLEPAFQTLIEAIRDEQKKEPAPLGEQMRLKVMALTATPRGKEEPFGLTREEKEAPAVVPDPPTEPIHHVWRRTHAKKALELHPIPDEKKALVPKVVELALAHKDSDSEPAVLVFVRTVEAVDDVVNALKKGKVPSGNVAPLTGTMRGRERDQLATENPVFARFKKDSRAERQPGTVYLVCTSAGEVGVDISADHMICDLSTFDSMAQRFGRVNRYGLGSATIHVVRPTAFDAKGKPLEAARERTLGLLDRLRRNPDGTRDASPAALGELIERAIREGSGGEPSTVGRAEALRKYILTAFAPPPTILPTSDILFDAWALTTVREKLPGRPLVEPYLHGVEDDKSFDTEFAWREEVALLTGKVPDDDLAELMDDFPLKPHEVLRVPTYGKGRAYEQLAVIAEKSGDLPAWVIEPDGELIVYKHLRELVAKRGNDYVVPLAGRTVVLPPKAGGLTEGGTLKGDTGHSNAISYDVAGTPSPKVAPLLRLKVVTGEGTATFKLVAPIQDWDADFAIEYEAGEDRIAVLNYYLTDRGHRTVKPARRLDLTADSDDDEAAGKVSEYLVVKPIPEKKDRKANPEWPVLDAHRDGVKGGADAICSRLGLPADIRRAVVLAAWWHDLGKGRRVWQRGAGNQPQNKPVSKPIHGRPPENLNHFRHELGSVIDACGDPSLAKEFDGLAPWAQELTLHLIAAHHGRARPHFPGTEATDPERPAVASDAVAADTPGRYARLQRRFGRWGLAYLESLIRAADALDSQRIEATPLGEAEGGTWPGPPTGFAWPSRPATPEPTIRVAVDPTNPGQFFACCGLLELADRLWPQAADHRAAEGWFADGRFEITCGGTLRELLASAQQIQFAGNAEEEAEDGEEDEDEDEKAVVTPLEIVAPVTMRLDWWQDINLKPWAGSMNARNIALAMCRAIDPDHPDPLNQSQVVPEVKENPKATKSRKPPKPKPKEPFHFDARRGANALGRDVGFIHDTLKKKWKTPMFAHPVVEFFALLGLQRSRPQPTGKLRVYDYFTWSRDWRCQASVLPLAVCGLLGDPHARRYRFVNAFRTGQKKHKAYMPAFPLPTGDRP